MWLLQFILNSLELDKEQKAEGEDDDEKEAKMTLVLPKQLLWRTVAQEAIETDLLSSFGGTTVKSTSYYLRVALTQFLFAIATLYQVKSTYSFVGIASKGDNAKYEKECKALQQ